MSRLTPKTTQYLRRLEAKIRYARTPTAVQEGRGISFKLQRLNICYRTHPHGGGERRRIQGGPRTLLGTVATVKHFHFAQRRYPGQYHPTHCRCAVTLMRKCGQSQRSRRSQWLFTCSPLGASPTTITRYGSWLFLHAQQDGEQQSFVSMLSCPCKASVALALPQQLW